MGPLMTVAVIAAGILLAGWVSKKTGLA